MLSGMNTPAYSSNSNLNHEPNLCPIEGDNEEENKISDIINNQKIKERVVCTCCHVKLKDTLIVTCKHVVFCSGCDIDWKLKAANNGIKLECPVCRKEYKKTIKLKLW